MMSSHSVETLVEPMFGRRMPSYSQNVAPATGLSQPQNMSSFMGKQYSGAYFSFRPPGKDIVAFPVPDRQSPVTHVSSVDKQHIYRQDSRSNESHLGYANSSTKQGFTRYTKSPVICSPKNTASVIVRRGHAGGDSAPTDRPVYLGVPQAVYRHSPCCNDLCCAMGHGSPNRAYDHTWKTREPSDPLLQHRPGHTDAVGVSMFSPGQTRTLPAVVNQTYSPMKVKEVSHSLQCSPRAYPSLYPSQTAYEPMIYHNNSPISKYGQALQHPVFYYPPANMEVEKRTESKNTDFIHKEEVPVVLKHPLQPPGDQYVLPPSLHGEISLPRREAMQNPAFLQGFEYPAYLVPRLNVNTSPIHNNRHPHTVNCDLTNTSSNHVHRPFATLASGYRDRFSQHSEHSSVHVAQTSPTTCIRKSAGAPSSTQSLNRYEALKNSVYNGPPGGVIHGPPSRHAPAHLDLDVRSSRHPAYHVRSYPKHPLMSPTLKSNSNPSGGQKILYCPPLPSFTKTSPNPQPSYLHKGPLKRALSVSSPIKIHDDDDDVYVVENEKKRQKTERGNADVKSVDVASRMPVINNVFSLAPYQTYLQMSRLFLDTLHQGSSIQGRTEQSNENVKQPFAISEDFVSKSPPVREDVATKHVKRRDVRSDSPKAMVIKNQENLRQIQQRTQRPSFEVKVKREHPDGPPHTCAAMPELVPLDLKLRPNRADTDPKTCKKESDETTDQSSCSETSEYSEQLVIIKKEPEEIDQPEGGPVLEIKKCDSDLHSSRDDNRTSGGECGQREATPTRSPPPALSAPPHLEARFNFLNIPPECLKLSNYNIIFPEGHLLRSVQKPAKSPEEQNTQPTVPDVPLQMPVRKHFFELHQSLTKLISKSVAATSEDTLRAWLSQMELNHITPSKNQKVSCLLGSKGQNACLNEEMKSSLQQVYQRLTEYSQERCPFPFVMRAGAIFLPMLVVKEVLFPSVHNGLIDQVLQEHKVVLRPTTLSEEKALIQMNKRACSSRLRRLMSYKHLPDVYTDVVNLLYYTCVCKQLGLELDHSVDAEADESCAGPSSSRSSPVPPSPHDDSEELQSTSLLKRRSRIKRSSRRMFLDCSSDEGEQNGSPESALDPDQQPAVSDGSGASWMCPLLSEELPADVMGGKSNMQPNFKPSLARQFQEKSKKRSGVILRLRRTSDRKRMSYRPVLDSEKLHLETRQSGTDSAQEPSGQLVRRTAEVARWKRTSFSNSLRPLNAYSKRKLRSLLTIKYCPYLSACHSADYKRRWVLRSAVQRARRAMKIYYPDLVGKKIQHLYEEDDKSEVWYKGEVLQIHKAHHDPVKTVFEVRYDSEPEWKYYLELLIDYKKGWLKIED
ncbi:uncharacterized protein C15orf39 homolog [Eucyclogobius newberryi]|uniref:uncharacterized protein C15orf39 homolog n=1 Tax=Eucyclogobius newberryi TaxID=166745 RepID=UPI003B5CAC2C